MRARSAVLAASTLLLAGCGGGSATSSSSRSTPSVRPAGAVHLSSPAFAPGAAIPRRYTCDGSDAALPVRWSGIPRGARELVLVMRDLDAPGGNFVHWAVAGISPAAAGLDPGRLPPGAVQGRNSFGSIGYRGPCPPAGESPHHYVLMLSALAAQSGLSNGFSPEQLRAPALGSGTVTGTYGRP